MNADALRLASRKIRGHAEALEIGEGQCSEPIAFRQFPVGGLPVPRHPRRLNFVLVCHPHRSLECTRDRIASGGSRPLPRPTSLPRIARRRSSVHGYGVFAEEPITKNTRIIDYAGELVRNDAECEARE